MKKTSHAHKKLIPLIKTKINYKAYAISAVMVIVLIFSMIMFNNVYTGFISEVLGYKQPQATTNITQWWHYIIALFIMCLIPAIFEEVFFRGIIYNGLRRFGAVASVIMASVLFIFMHDGLYQLFYQFILSVILIIAIKQTGDLKLSMFMHFLNNLLVLILDKTLNAERSIYNMSAGYMIGAFMLLLVAAAAIAGYLWLLKKFAKGQELKEEPELVTEDGKMMVILAFVVGIAYYIYIIVYGFVGNF